MRRHAQIPSEPLYSEDRYNQLKRVVLMSPLWQEINQDPHATAMITNRLQKDVLSFATIRINTTNTFLLIVYYLC